MPPTDVRPGWPRWAWTVLIAGSLVGAMVIGVWVRWAMAGGSTLPLPFDNLRHGHSHLGYFGVLFPLAWLGWRASDAPVPGPRGLWLYAVFNAVALVGFLRSGYGVIAIVGSTAIAAVWVWSAVPLVRRMRRLGDPLAVAPLGILLSLACVPPIALTLRSDPVLASGLVSTFLSGLLFLVIVPSALGAARVSPGPWPLFLIAGALGALALGVAPQVATRAGLLVYAALIAAPAVSSRLESHVRVAWAAVCVGLVLLALGLLPNTRPVALGAIHFLILGPLLATLVPSWLPREIPGWAWWLGHGIWGTMAAALVAQAFFSAPWTWTAAALGGTGTLLWWVAVLAYQAKGPTPRGIGPSLI